MAARGPGRSGLCRENVPTSRAAWGTRGFCSREAGGEAARAGAVQCPLASRVSGCGEGRPRVTEGDRALVAEPLGADMEEQAEAAVITPAMLEEEEQLEAAGLEQERQMLEKVRGGPRRGLSECLGAGAVRFLGLQNKQTW